MEKKYLWILAGVLLIANVHLLWNSNKFKKDCSIVIGSMQEKVQERHSLDLQLSANLSCINVNLDTLQVFDRNFGVHQITDVIDSDVIIFRFSDEYCISCNNYALEVFMESVKDIDKENIVFLYSCENRRTFNYDIRQFGLDEYNVYGISEKVSDLDDIGFPYYVSVDREMRVRCVYVPSEGMDEFDKETFGKLLYKQPS